MPSCRRRCAVSPTDLVTTVRLRDFPRRWIDAYVSHDDGRSWSYLATPAPDIGQGNPPALVRLADGRLCLTYGYRGEPYAIHARFSSDQGKTWTRSVRASRQRWQPGHWLSPFRRAARRQGCHGLRLS